jgi:dienelactone hydrolase
VICRSVLVILSLLAAVASARAADFPTLIRFPSVALGKIEAGPELTGWIYRPDGPGPFPAIIFAHSCAGYTSRVNDWGWRLAEWGYFVLAPESFGPRGKAAVCGIQGVVTPDMRVADIAGALDYLKTRPDVKKGHIGLMGQSHGGSTTIKALQKGHDLARRGLRGGVAYYPGCSASRDRDVGLPLLILIGDKDDWTRAEWCRELQAKGFENPTLVEVKYYPDAYHSFDAPVNRTMSVAGKKYHLEYDPVAAPDAEARTRAFFDKLLR